MSEDSEEDDGAPIALDEEHVLAIITNSAEEPAIRLELMANFVKFLAEERQVLIARNGVLESRVAATMRVLTEGSAPKGELERYSRLFSRMALLAPVYFWRFVEGDDVADCLLDGLSESEEAELAVRLQTAQENKDLEAGECVAGECACPNRCTYLQGCVMGQIISD